MMKNKILSNGLEMPCIGFGTYKAPDDADGINAIRIAIRTGYRLLDTAAMYNNEECVGKAIRNAGIARDKLFVTTKLANPDRGYDSTLKAFRKSLDLLRLDYLDLYLIHWPADPAHSSDWERINAETWRAMECLLEDGRVRAIGVSNFHPKHLNALAESARILPMVNQIEFHPGWMQPEVLEWCDNNNVIVEGWSPLGRTRLFENPLLNEIAVRYGKSVAQICLRWAVQHGVIPIPKSMNPERMTANLDIFDFELSPADMNMINAMPPTGQSGLTPDSITF